MADAWLSSRRFQAALQLWLLFVYILNGSSFSTIHAEEAGKSPTEKEKSGEAKETEKVLLDAFSQTQKLVGDIISDGEVMADVDVERAANALRRKLTDLTGFLQASRREVSKVVPAFEWAQSADFIFISVKFAHKLDTPACINLDNVETEIQELSVSMTGICRGKNKEFNLHIPLLKAIDTKNSTWSMASVGRGTFTLKKQKGEMKWARLLKSREKPKNMHVWFGLQEKYEKELEEAVKKEEERKKEEAEAAKQATEQEEAKKDDSETQVEQTDKEEKETEKAVNPKEEQLEAEKKKQKKGVKKAAKLEKKKLKKQKKADLKEIDGKIAELEKQIENLKKDKTNKTKEYEKLYAKVDENLSADIAEIDRMTIDDLENDGSASTSIFQRLKSFLGVSSSGEEEKKSTEEEKKSTDAQGAESVEETEKKEL